MDELGRIERFIAFRREIAEIRDANRAYWARGVHNKREKELHERRRRRLEEISEKPSALGRSKN